MKQVWKWIMQLNAKAFCFIAVLLLCATGGWCVYQINTPLESMKDGTGKLPKPPDAWSIGILDFVTSQLAGDDLSVPITPFWWTIDAILTDPNVRTNLIAARHGYQNPSVGGVGLVRGPGGGGNNRVGPPGGGSGAGTGGPSEPKMVTPKISFLGFFKRSDGNMAAMFSDSSDRSTVFYTPGKKVHGIEILSVDTKEALVRLPDGSETKISIGGPPIELPPEPEKTTTPPPAAAKG